MSVPICHVVGAGDFFAEHFSPQDGDLIIAADGGYRYLAEIGVEPDLLIGDFDSLHQVPRSVETQNLQVEKDITDMRAAIDAGLARGFSRFALHAGLGDEFDHAIANIQTLAYLADLGASGILYGATFAATVIKDTGITLPARAAGIVSVFSLSNTAEGVSIEGLYYELHEHTLTNSFPIGARNAFIGEPAHIVVKSGTLLLIYPV